MSQANMFKNGEDLPLFSQTAPRPKPDRAPAPPEQRGAYLPTMRPTFGELAKAKRDREAQERGEI